LPFELVDYRLEYSGFNKKQVFAFEMGEKINYEIEIIIKRLIFKKLHDVTEALVQLNQFSNLLLSHFHYHLPTEKD
jgi:hypothetical protein